MTDWFLRHRLAFEFTLAAVILVAIATVAISARHLVEQYEAVRPLPMETSRGSLGAGESAPPR